MENHPKLLTVRRSSVPLHSWVSVLEELKVLVLVRVRGGSKGGEGQRRKEECGFAESPKLEARARALLDYST